MALNEGKEVICLKKLVEIKLKFYKQRFPLSRYEIAKMLGGLSGFHYKFITNMIEQDILYPVGNNKYNVSTKQVKNLITKDSVVFQIWYLVKDWLD